ncbi:MAG TPA: hypothetical protein ENJ18_03295 [Nannocystis exedens]|nr:hypothetical protein [Nannocystis exedens]
MGFFSKKISVLAFVGLGVGLSACVREERFVYREAEAWCHYEVECGRYRSVSVCIGAVAENIEDPYLLAAIDAGRVDYDAAKARRCIRAIKDLKCTTDEEEALAAAEELCAEVMTGQVAPDEPCLRDVECVGTRSQCAFIPGSCSGDTSCCPGLCRYIKDDVGIGEKCSAAAFCAEDLDCVTGEGGESRCRERPGEGEKCPLGRCAEGLSCSWEESESYCRRLVPIGEPCVSGLSCDGGWCNENGICAKYGGIGDPCEWDCRQGKLVCDDYKCSEPAKIGDDCSERKCIGYAHCVDDICIEYKSSGEDCSGGRDVCYEGLSCDYDSGKYSCTPYVKDLAPSGDCPVID